MVENLDPSALRRYVGQALRARRDICGFSQKQVAQALGYESPSTVSNWERGSRMPDIVDIYMMARLYRVMPAAFLPQNDHDSALSGWSHGYQIGVADPSRPIAMGAATPEAAAQRAFGRANDLRP